MAPRKTAKAKRAARRVQPPKGKRAARTKVWKKRKAAASTRAAKKKRAQVRAKRVKKPAKAPKVRRPARKPAARPKQAPAALPSSPKHFGLHQEVDLPQLSEQAPRDEAWEIFRTYDRDNSGYIDRSELSRLLEALGQQPTEIELAIALDVVDADNSGKISWSEFSAWWRSR